MTVPFFFMQSFSFGRSFSDAGNDDVEQALCLIIRTRSPCN